MSHTLKPAPPPAPPAIARPADRARGRSAVARLLASPAAPIASTAALLVLLLWVGSKMFEPFVFPPLQKIVSAIGHVLTEETGDLRLTLVRFVVALLAAMVVGWGVGLLMGAYRRTVGRFVNPIIALVQAVPALSWVLLAILWMTSVELRIAFVTFMIAFPFFVIAVYEGIRDMDKDMLEAVEQFRPSRLQVLRMVLVPQSLVNVIMTFRATAAMTLKLMVFAELIGANDGIGYRLSLAQSNFRVDYILAWTLVLIGINFLLLWATDKAESRILRWRAEAVVR